MFANAKSGGADKIVANNQKSANAKTGGAEPRPYGVNKDCGKKIVAKRQMLLFQKNIFANEKLSFILYTCPSKGSF